MVKKDEFDNAIESLRVEIAAIRTSISDMENDLIQVLREENISLKNRIKRLVVQFERADIIPNKIDQYSRRNNVVVDGKQYKMDSLGTLFIGNNVNPKK